jgi:molybdopterin molybdotransferase
MLSVEEAQRLVAQHAAPLPPRVVSLAEASGLVLAEPVAADLDSPPFDKALMDGFAVRAADLMSEGPIEFEVVEEVPAGSVPTCALGTGQVTSIMTGAPLPPGADAVVMVEHAVNFADGRVVLKGPARPGQNRLDRGREYGRGAVLLREGDVLTPARVGLLAAVGRASVRVVPRPRVAVVPTGDELVDVSSTPGPGQIRDSNSPMLRAYLAEAGADLLPASPIGRDRADALRTVLSGAFDAGADVLVLSGGVSAGQRDLVPAVLEDLGVRRVFHKVRLKPGKPLWFGVGPERTLVFGLPGNPVSGVVGTLLFVAPTIRAVRGLSEGERGPFRKEAILATPFTHRGDRPTYHPGRVVGVDAGVLRVEPLAWAGSPDLFTVTRADGFLHFPEGDREYRAGESVAWL